MRDIELQTRDGHFVATVEIAPFPDRGMPEVVSWGDRVFVREQRSPGRAPELPWVYLEACAAVSFTASPGKEQVRPAPTPPPPPVDRRARDVVGEAVAPGQANTADRGDGQQKGYVVLTDAERAKGFVRPVRRSYRHVGERPKHPTRDLTAEERERHKDVGYVAYEEYPAGSQERVGSVVGRFWTAAQLASGCGSVTTMGQKIAETYARDPSFYGATFCCHCGTHPPVGSHGEFVWEGTDERVGT